MRDNDCWAKAMRWAAVGVFLLILFVVLFAFQPTREFFCSRYEVAGVERLLAFIRGNETNCFWGFLYDFQTLITGLLAVGAATVAVWQSRKIDALQHRRHNQLVALSIRPDYLILDRAYVPVEEILDNVIEEMKAIIQALTKAPEKMWQRVVNDPIEFISIFQRATSTLELEEIKAAMPLFDGETAMVYSKARMKSKHLVSFFQQMQREIGGFQSTNDRRIQQTDINARLASLKSYLIDVEQELTHLSQNMRGFMRLYETLGPHDAIKPSPDQS